MASSIICIPFPEQNILVLKHLETLSGLQKKIQLGFVCISIDFSRHKLKNQAGQNSSKKSDTSVFEVDTRARSSTYDASASNKLCFEQPLAPGVLEIYYFKGLIKTMMRF